MTTALFILGAYLLGAIPFGLLIGLARGIDVRQHGSRNIGATNVGRVVGRRWGQLCLVLDILKGLVPTALAGWLLVGPDPDSARLLVWLAVGLAAVLGHVFPVFLGFRGGKGVATTVGVALGLYPFFTWPMVAALAAYAIVRYSSGAVSAGSLTIAVVFPAVLVLTIVLDRRATFATHWPLIAAAGVLGLLIIVRHRENIARLLRGEELRTRGRSGDGVSPAAEPSPRS